MENTYEIELLDEPVKRRDVEFRYRIKRNFEVTYNHPVKKLEDGNYETQEITLPAGSTVMLFEDKEVAEVSLGLLTDEAF